MIVLVVADWLVVRPAMRKRATASRIGAVVTSPPSGSTMVSWFAEMNVSAIHAMPNRAMAATKPDASSD